MLHDSILISNSFGPQLSPSLVLSPSLSDPDQIFRRGSLEFARPAVILVAELHPSMATTTTAAAALIPNREATMWPRCRPSHARARRRGRGVPEQGRSGSDLVMGGSDLLASGSAIPMGRLLNGRPTRSPDVCDRAAAKAWPSVG